MIKLTDILTESYGTYVDNAQNKALKRVGKKYGSAGKKTPSKIKIPKSKAPKIDMDTILKNVKNMISTGTDMSKFGIPPEIQQKIDQEKKTKEKYKDNDRASNIQNGVDVIKDNKDLEHFQNDFIHKADKVDRIDHEEFVRSQFGNQINKLSTAEKNRLKKDIDSWKGVPQVLKCRIRSQQRFGNSNDIYMCWLSG